MSQHFENFNKNINRVENLCSIFNKRKGNSRPSVVELDFLRAAVVFLHSSLESYLRDVISEILPGTNNQEALEHISLPGSYGQSEKFNLKELLKYREKTVSDLIAEAVKSYMSGVSFGNYGCILQWLNRINIKIDGFGEKQNSISDINDMINRRHKIVHEADSNPKKGQGQHSAAAINIETVKKWKKATIELVEIIEEGYNQIQEKQTPGKKKCGKSAASKTLPSDSISQ